VNYKSGYNAAGAYNIVKYGPLANSSSTTSKLYPITKNTLVVGNYQEATYKYTFDKTLWIIGGYETDLVFVPTFFVADFLPQASVFFMGAQLDAKYDIYNTWQEASLKATDPITQTYLEPKLTYDFGNVGVKGFKAYVAGRAALATTDAAYGAAGSTTAWHDSRVQPGVSYSTALEGIGTLGCDLSVRFNKIDYDANNTKDNPTPSVANSAKPGSNDVRLNLTYSQKF